MNDTITSNLLAHRAKLLAYVRLEETCRVCAQHGCLDCDCQRTGKKMPHQM